MRDLQLGLVRALLDAGARNLPYSKLEGVVADALLECGLVRQLRTTRAADASAALHRTVVELIKLARRAG